MASHTNTLLTADQITQRAQAVLHSNAVFTGTINREYDSSFAQSGAKIGSSMRIRLPAKYTVSTGAALSAQNHTETSVSLPVTTQAHVDTSFTTADLALSVDEFDNRIISPAISQLAAYIDNDTLSMYNTVGPSVGTPGTTPKTFLIWAQAKAKLNQQATPKDMDRCAILDSLAAASTSDNLRTLFQPATSLSRQYLEATMGRAAGLDFFESDLIQTHTTGAFGDGTNTAVDTSISTGQTAIDMAGFSVSTPSVKKGDVFTIAAVFDVHPETKQAYSHLKQFVVTADKTGSSNAIAAVAFSPAINSSGPFQNIDALPVTTAVVTFLGTASTIYPQNMVYHKNAFTLATADLIMPNDVHFKSRRIFEGISMRLITQYTISDDAMPSRFDVLYGYKELHDVNREPQACRVWG